MRCAPGNAPTTTSPGFNFLPVRSRQNDVTRPQLLRPGLRHSTNPTTRPDVRGRGRRAERPNRGLSPLLLEGVSGLRRSAIPPEGLIPYVHSIARQVGRPVLQKFRDLANCSEVFQPRRHADRRGGGNKPTGGTNLEFAGRNEVVCVRLAGISLTCLPWARTTGRVRDVRSASHIATSWAFDCRSSVSGACRTVALPDRKSVV